MGSREYDVFVRTDDRTIEHYWAGDGVRFGPEPLGGHFDSDPVALWEWGDSGGHLHLIGWSGMVRTDMVPLLPDRSLDAHQQADGLHVALSGLSRKGTRPNRVIASIESCDSPDVPGVPVELTSLTGAAPGFPAWVRVAGATVTGRTNEPLSALAVPAEAGRLRVVVREVEELAPSLDGVVDAARELSERTVYVDVVPLPIG